MTSKMNNIKNILTGNMPKAIKKPELYQNIIIEFDDGTKILSSIPSFCDSEEKLRNLKIKNIMITQPKELPEGTSFQTIAGE